MNEEQVWKNQFNNNNEGTDFFNSKVIKSHYGQQISTGWEVDHKIPVSLGGSNDYSNLQVLQWENNREKADNRSGIIRGKQFKW